MGPLHFRRGDLSNLNRLVAMLELLVTSAVLWAAPLVLSFPGLLIKWKLRQTLDRKYLVIPGLGRFSSAQSSLRVDRSLVRSLTCRQMLARYEARAQNSFFFCWMLVHVIDCRVLNQWFKVTVDVKLQWHLFNLIKTKITFCLRSCRSRSRRRSGFCASWQSLSLILVFECPQLRSGWRAL